MSSHSPRDRSMERLLRTRLGAGRAGQLPPATDDCIDAETLAAWSDRTLAAADLQRVETHLADCVRCQSMLATFAQTAPAAHAVVPFWQRWTTQWLVPIAAVGAAGIAVVIWTSTHPRTSSSPAPATQVAQATPSTPEVIVPPVPPTVVPPSELTMKQPHATGNVAPKKADTQVAQSAESVVAGRTKSIAGAPVPVAQAAAPPPAAAAAPPARPTPPPPQPTLPPPPQPQAPPVSSTVTVPLPAAPPSGTAVNTAAQARANSGVMLDAVNAVETKTASVVIAEFAAGATGDAAASTLVAGAGAGGRGGGRGGAGGGGGARAATPPPTQNVAGLRQSEVVSAGVRWRIHLDYSVEKSTTGGARWDRINFDPPQPQVTGGVAPSADVCWLIGRKGLVLRSIDGAKFTPLTFPEAVDLRSIVAPDAQRATVTTTDGRMFATVNGGISWNPGLQDFRPPPF